MNSGFTRKRLAALIGLAISLTAEGAPEYGNFVMHWFDEYNVGLKGNWASSDLDGSTWKTVDILGGFSELGVPDTPAVAWLRKEITLPDRQWQIPH